MVEFNSFLTRSELTAKSQLWSLTATEQVAAKKCAILRTILLGISVMFVVMCQSVTSMPSVIRVVIFVISLVLVTFVMFPIVLFILVRFQLNVIIVILVTSVIPLINVVLVPLIPVTTVHVSNLLVIMRALALLVVKEKDLLQVRN